MPGFADRDGSNPGKRSMDGNHRRRARRDGEGAARRAAFDSAGFGPIAAMLSAQVGRGRRRGAAARAVLKMFSFG
jgi:hypothetical protein